MEDQHAPQGVAVIGIDGTEIPLRDVRRLPDEHGIAVWLAVVPAGLAVQRPLRVRIARLPERTALRVERRLPARGAQAGVEVGDLALAAALAG